jgi:hypothetical protein
MVDYTVHGNWEWFVSTSGSTIDIDRADTAGLLGERGMALYTST